MSENQEANPVESPAEQPQKSSKRGWLIGAFAAIGLLVIAAVVLFVIFDPFGLVAMLFGGGRIAAIIPDDVSFYAEMDLLVFQSEDMGEIIEAFQDAAGEVPEEPEDYQDILEETFGITPDDVLPWLGQHTGLAITELDYDNYYQGEDPPMVVIIESRDKDEADAFIETVLDHREDEFDEDFDEAEFDGAVFYNNEDEYQPLIFGRYKNHVFFATDEDALEDVLDLAKEGRRAEDTLADLEDYQATMKSLPNDALLLAYLNLEEVMAFYQDSLEDSAGGMVMTNDIYDNTSGGGMAVSIVEEGIRIQVTTLYTDPEDLPWADLDMDMSGYTLQTSEMLPEETFLYFSGYVPEGYAEIYFDTLNEDYLESMELLGEELDVDFEDLIYSLEGEVGFAAFEQEDGFLSEFFQMPFGISLIIGINDDAEWDKLFNQLTDLASFDPTLVIDEVDLDDIDLLSLEMDDGYNQYPFIIYGAGDQFAVLSTGVDNAEILIGEGDTLAGSSSFQEVWEAFPDDDWPFFYLDLQTLMEIIEDVSANPIMGDDLDTAAADVNTLEPLTAIAATNTFYNQLDRQTITVILFIDR
jgi:predicted 3-demethylubiquinone-9 3-methyltransferase (glyoxalase superfamily)